MQKLLVPRVDNPNISCLGWDRESTTWCCLAVAAILNKSLGDSFASSVRAQLWWATYQPLNTFIRAFRRPYCWTTTLGRSFFRRSLWVISQRFLLMFLQHRSSTSNWNTSFSTQKIHKHADRWRRRRAARYLWSSVLFWRHIQTSSPLACPGNPRETLGSAGFLQRCPPPYTGPHCQRHKNTDEVFLTRTGNILSTS